METLGKTISPLTAISHKDILNYPFFLQAINLIIPPAGLPEEG